LFQKSLDGKLLFQTTSKSFESHKMAPLAFLG
jgi:hypothetical protein